MKKKWKILITVIILLIILISFIIAISVGLSSHNIDFDTRKKYNNQFYKISIVGVIVILNIWIRFTKYLKK